MSYPVQLAQLVSERVSAAAVTFAAGASSASLSMLAAVNPRSSMTCWPGAIQTSPSSISRKPQSMYQEAVERTCWTAFNGSLATSPNSNFHLTAYDVWHDRARLPFLDRHGRAPGLTSPSCSCRAHGRPCSCQHLRTRGPTNAADSTWRVTM